MSEIDLPGAKAPSFLEMQSEITGLSLLIKIFVISLLETLHKLIGQNWLTDSGKLTFRVNCAYNLFENPYIF